MVNIDGAKGKFFCLFAMMNCQKGIKKKKNHLVRFRNKEEVKRKFIKNE